MSDSDYRYDEWAYEQNTIADQQYWNCFTDVANATEPDYLQNFMRGNWSTELNERADGLKLIPSHRAVGVKQVYYKPGSELKIQITGSDKFKTDVQNVLMTAAQPFVNLKFTFVNSGGNITIDNNYTGGGVTRCLGCQNPSISISSAQTGLVIHEFGHALGMYHEMKNPNIKLTWIESVLIQMYGNAEFVKSQITSPIAANQVNATAFDKNSVMIYPLPATTNKEGIAMVNSNKYTDLDRQWLAQTYGQPQQPPPSSTSTIQPSQPPDKPNTNSSTTIKRPPPIKPGTTSSTIKRTTQQSPPIIPGTSQPFNNISVPESWLDNIILLLISLFVKQT